MRHKTGYRGLLKWVFRKKNLKKNWKPSKDRILGVFTYCVTNSIKLIFKYEWDSWRSHGWIFAYWTCLYFSLFLWIVILLSGMLKHKNLKKLFKNLGFSSPDREKSTVSAYALCVVRGSGRHGLVLTVYRSCCGAVYCNRSCLFVGLYVCRSVTTITRNCVHRSSPNLVCIVIISTPAD